MALRQFYTAEEAVAGLNGQVLAAHLVITLLAGAGIRQVCPLLALSGLSAFVASAYGRQQKLNVALEEAVVADAEQQRQTLAAQMPRRRISVGEDETDHPEVCLVAMEPVSSFMLRERSAPDRSAATWTRALAEALEGLRVAVVQGTGDAAKGLLRHVAHDLGAHHSPDLFHVQHEVSKATTLPLARAVEPTPRASDQASDAVAAQRAARDAHQQAWPRPCGRPPACAERINDALMAPADADVQSAQAEAHQQQARACARASPRPSV